MVKSPGVQEVLFHIIKKQLPKELSFVHEIADILELSYDSAYRRIRGDKTLSCEELLKLSSKYNR
jgi:hypothetical protein